jgi:hypothetical protein
MAGESNQFLQRSAHPVFSQPVTIGFIDELASSDEPLVIFAGGGVTVDRIGLSWAGLVRELFTKTDPDRQIGVSLIEHAEMIVERHEPIPAATALLRLHVERLEDEDELLAIRNIQGELNGILYSNREWLGGRLATQIARLCLTRAAAGLKTAIVTSNFDAYLEETLENERAAMEDDALPKIRRRTATELASSGADPLFDSAYIDLVYLHGYVPKGAVGLELEPTAVLSECQYFESEEVVLQVLRAAFESARVLIIGSSLIDQPLLRALHRTKPIRPRGFAVIPFQDEHWSYDSREQQDAQTEYARLRLGDFAVAPAFVDFFGQIAQFVSEIDLATQNRPARYRDSDFEYSGRLAKWWTNWRAMELERPHSLGPLSRRQFADYRALTDARTEVETAVRVAVGRADPNPIKLECWLRWDPGHQDERRKLRLWASSSGLLTTLNAMTEDDIHPGSPYVAVQTFCAGQPKLVVAERLEQAGEFRRGRWRTYLATPIWIDAPYSLTVGVVALAEMGGDLRNVSRRERSSILELLQEVGRKIALRELRPLGDVSG